MSRYGHLRRNRRYLTAMPVATLGAAAFAAFVSTSAVFSTTASAFEIEPDFSGFFNGVTGLIDTSVIGQRDVQYAGDAEAHLDLSVLFDNGIKTGLHLEGGIEGGSQRVQQPEGEIVEQAFVFVDTFLGKFHVGRIDGIGARYSYVAPSLFYGNAINDRETDLTRINGINSVNTIQNGFDDYSLKVEYTSPRLLGLQAGVSFAPKVEDCESDYCHSSAFFDGSRDYENVFEVGLDYLQSYSNGLSIGVSATYLHSDVTDIGNIFAEDVNSYAFGANMSLGGFTIGGSFKESNLGDSRGDYMSYDVGASYELGSWGFMVAYGADESDVGLATIGLLGPSLPQSTKAYQTGVDYNFQDKVSLGGGVQHVEADRPTGAKDEDATVVFLETMFKF